MARACGKKGMPYLFSGLIASGVAAAVLFAGRMAAIHLEHATIPSTAPELFSLKNQGLAFQRAAAQAPNVLLLYGSSELLVPAVPEKGANFSAMAVSEMIFGTALDFELKRDIASRMLIYRSTLENRPLLEFALRRLASGRWLDRVIFCALWPAGKVQTSLLELQDHAAALNYIRHKIKPAPQPHAEVLDWSKLIGKVSGTK